MLLLQVFYGFLPVASMIAFDDPFRNNVTASMAQVAVSLPTGT